MLRRHAFTDAPNTSVVLCFPGREVRVVDGYGGAKWRRKGRGVQRRKQWWEGLSIQQGDRLNRKGEEKSEQKWI